MQVQKNSAELWDGLWQKPASLAKDTYRVRKEERLIRWQRMETMIQKRFGGFKDLSVIEIGAGTGTNAALMAERGARVSILDYSAVALARAERLFQGLGLSATFINADALSLETRLLNQFDVSMSFGLAEHFVEPKRTQIIKSHLELLKPNGITFISVPNAANPPYRLHKWITERTRAWSVGEEYPFSRRELTTIGRALGLREMGFFGDSLWRSKRFLNPLKWLPRHRTPPAAAAAPDAIQAAPARAFVSRRLPRRERGTPWDAHLSYALVLWAAKPDGP